MAENRNYRLDIYINESGQVQGVSNPITPSNKVGTGGGTNKQSKKPKINKGVYTSYAIITPILNGALQSVQQRVDTLQSNTELSQRVALGINVISKMEGAIGRFASGSAIATALGLGSLAGGGVGLAVFGIETAVNLALKSQQIELSKQVENERNNILLGRMGTQFNGSRGVK